MLDLTLEESAVLGRPSTAAGALLAYLANRAGWEKPTLEGSFAGIPSCEITQFTEGSGLYVGSDYTDAASDHPAIHQAEALLKTWPEQIEEAAFLWARIYPIQLVRLENDRGVHGYGCTCGGVGGAPFEVYSTVYDPLGFLEGIVHEQAHWKLHTLGVHLESWPQSFLGNDFADLYESPIRKDIKRPMGAVVHAHYSYLHVIEIALRRFEFGVNDFPNEPAYVDGLRTNLGRMIEGNASLADLAQPGPLGRAFFENIRAWSFEVIRRAQQILE